MTWTVALSPAAPAAAKHVAPPERLEALADAATLQFQLAYRHDPVEWQRRDQRLADAMERWRAAPRDETSDRLLAEWLRGAIRDSMPGSAATLPAPPVFAAGSRAPLDTHSIDDKSVGDPFGDDPDAEQ